MGRSTSVRSAAVLAAGRGTRMKHLTEDIPKPLLPVAGKPLLEHILEMLRDAGIERFAIVTGYLAEKIEQHFGDGSRLGVEIRYQRQEIRDGTARALLLTRGSIGASPFVLAWGDILTERTNYPAMLRRFDEIRADGLLCVNWIDDPYRGAAVYVDSDGRIEKIVEKPPKGTATTHWNNAGIGAFGPMLFEYAAKVEKSPRGEYELPDAIAAMIRDRLRVYAFPLEGHWSDVGTPEDLAAVEARLKAS
jgi:NDP-sugar pyrophosphorylase family protein